MLIAEDHKDTRELWSEVLSLNGYQVSIVPNGKLLLQLIRTTPPPFIVILDLFMPRVSGYEVIDELHRLGMAPFVPLLVVSAHEPGFPRVYPGIRFRAKPLPPEELVDEVRAMTDAANGAARQVRLLQVLAVESGR